MNPYIIFDLNNLERNIKKLKENCPDVKFLLPVKCCTNKKVLRIANKFLDGFDVSNKTEYKLIANYRNKTIASTGPLSFTNLDNKNILIAVNSLNYLDDGLGIRINFNSSGHFLESHFGEDMFRLSDDIADKLEYIHFHLADNRTKQVCDNIYELVPVILNKFKNLKKLNVGGHLENLSFEEAIFYINKIRSMIPKDIELYFEIGDLLFVDCGTLYASVVDIISNKEKQVVILNVSKMANLRWTYPKFKDKSSILQTEFYGCSCCETDHILNCLCHKLKLNEKVEFTNISPYSYQWNTSFNGIDKIKIYFL